MEGCDGKTLTVHEFMALLGERTFALSTLIFGVASAVLPGVSLLTALPIALVGFQMVMGRNYLWLPSKVAGTQMSEALLAKGLRKALPTVRKIELLFRPRMSFMFAPASDKLMGLCFMLLAGVLLLPLAGMNLVPGLLVVGLALSILERDGLAASLVMGAVVFGLFFTVEILKLALHQMFA